MLPDSGRQPGRHLDREHHGGLRHRDPAARRRLIHVPAGLPRRAPEPAGQHPGRLTRRHAPLGQLRGRVDPLSMLAAASATVDNHAINILPDMSLPGRDTPRPFQPPVAQRDVKAEVIYCVGGVGAWLVADSVVMAGADGGPGPGAGPGRRWDVALSFAGAQRDYVGQVAAALKARGVRCFYDADEQIRLWGTHLAEELPRIYARESAAVVVFVSADYAARDWTRLERRAAFSRAVREAGVYVLPARFDDSALPGLLPDLVAVDLRDYTPEQFADLVAAKLADLGYQPVPPAGRRSGSAAGGRGPGERGGPAAAGGARGDQRAGGAR